MQFSQRWLNWELAWRRDLALDFPNLSSVPSRRLRTDHLSAMADSLALNGPERRAPSARGAVEALRIFLSGERVPCGVGSRRAPGYPMPSGRDMFGGRVDGSAG